MQAKEARASRGQAPASTSGDFIRRTNEDYAAWCATKYTPEFNSKGPDLHGLWAWQEQQRRMDDLLRQAPINLNCKSEQKRLATLWGFVPAQTDSVQEDAARWNAWASGMVEACNSDEQEPAFLVALDKAIGDTEPPITLELLNEWTDAARKQGASHDR